MKVLFRKLHRWLGLIMALQIAAWMLSGFYFSLFPIAEIRGEHLVRPSESPGRQLVPGALPPDSALTAIDSHIERDWELESLSLQSIDGKAFWRIEGVVDEAPFVRLVDFDTGRVRPPMLAEEAVQRAQNLLLEPGHDPFVEWVEEAPVNLEFRSRVLPVWRVTYSEPENIHLYLDPWTGDLLASRTDRWRIFDFMWMLHIMDFDTRDNFNHLLLQGAALMGLLVTLGGLILWVLTTRIFRQKRREA